MIFVMILIIDNYDSFVHNLARYVKKLGHTPLVCRNDKITIEKIKTLKPTAIIISPGPKAPQDSGICIKLIKELGSSIPILGVCLGHQAIGEAYGGNTCRAQKPMHGKADIIEHDRSALFTNTPNPLAVGRYHSLISDISKAGQLKITATSKNGEVMAMQHKKYPVFGVQFHPESVLTPEGIEIIKNFISLAKDWHSKQVDI